MTVLRAVAGYLPGIDPAELQWQTLRFEDAQQRLEVDVPVLSAAQMTALATHVEQASRAQLKTLTVSEIIAIVDRAIARLLDPADPYRREAEQLLPIVTGYDAEMIRLGLTSFFKTFRAPQLQRFVAEDFANPKLLDEFQPGAKGGAARAFGPELLVHVWAGNVPALPLWSLVCGLLVKAGSIGKLPSAEPLFAGLFARLLAEVHPPLADCLAVVWWRGGDEAQAAPLYARADVVLAYGGNDALEQIRRQVPITARFLAVWPQARLRHDRPRRARRPQRADHGAAGGARRRALRPAGLLLAAAVLCRARRPGLAARVRAIPRNRARQPAAPLSAPPARARGGRRRRRLAPAHRARRARGLRRRTDRRCRCAVVRRLRRSAAAVGAAGAEPHGAGGGGRCARAGRRLDRRAAAVPADRRPRGGAGRALSARRSGSGRPA